MSSDGKAATVSSHNHLVAAVIAVTANGNHGHLQVIVYVLAFQPKSYVYTSFVLV